MKRKTLARAEMALAERIQELKDLEAVIETMPNLASRRIPFVIAQIDELRRMVHRGRMEQTRSAAIKIVRAMKEQAAQESALSCEACGWSLPSPDATNVLHVHHVIAVANGGTNAPDNLAMLCPNCHAVAHAIAGRGVVAGNREELLQILRCDPLNSFKRKGTDATFP